MKLVHWPLMGGLLHLVQGGWDWAGPQPSQYPPCCTKCSSPPINPSTASVPIIVLMYNGALLCGFNLGIKGLTRTTAVARRQSECAMFPIVAATQSLKVIQTDVCEYGAR